MAILLIRHGETALNAARVVQFPDTPLGDHGIAQAERLGRRLARRSIGLVVSSDYVRARMTAAQIVAHTGASLVEDPLLRERNFGSLRGCAYDALGAIDLFGPYFEPPGGESWPTFHARVDRAWTGIIDLAAGLAGDLAVVTHGLVLRSLLERRLDAAGHPVTPDLVVANTAVTIVDPAPPWRVETLACTTHLGEESRDSAPV